MGSTLPRCSTGEGEGEGEEGEEEGEVVYLMVDNYYSMFIGSTAEGQDPELNYDVCH